jgi:formate hydrogenlyase subunit 3/multisubunit Na+/H+ antiporter MnhD subunit
MNAPVLMFALPLLTAFLLPVIDRLSGLAGRWIGPLVLVGNLLLGALAWPHLQDAPLVLAMGGFRPPLGIVFYVDRMAMLFAMGVALGVLLLWPAWAQDKDRVRISTLTMVLVTATTGLALSGDLFNLFVCYELAAISSYGLAAAGGSAAAGAATLRYMVISSFGSALMLIGIALVYQATGTLNLAQLAVLSDALAGPQGLIAFIFILLGAGVKAELFPVNAWVPEVYGAAAQRVAGILAGIVSKLALLIIVRLLVLVFRQPEAQQILLVLGVLGVITGELAAWRAQDLTRMLACSSIGQLGVMFVAFSIPGPAGVFAGLAVALHHMLVKPALFLLAERWGGALTRLPGAAQKSPLAAACFVLLALSLVGIPPLPGFWAKFLVVTAALGQGTPAYAGAVAVILAAAVIEASYLARVAAHLYRRVTQPLSANRQTRAAVTVATCASAALVSATLWLAPLGNSLQVTAAQAADRDSYIHNVFPQGVQP